MPASSDDRNTFRSVGDAAKSVLARIDALQQQNQPARTEQNGQTEKKAS